MPVYEPDTITLYDESAGSLPVALTYDDWKAWITFEVDETEPLTRLWLAISGDVDDVYDVEISISNVDVGTASLVSTGAHGAGFGTSGQPTVIDTETDIPTLEDGGVAPFAGTYGSGFDLGYLYDDASPAGTWTVEIRNNTADPEVVHTYTALQLGINTDPPEAPVEIPTTETYVVQVMDLATPTADIAAEDVTTIEQWESLHISHPLNDGRTAQVTISMHDDVAGFLAPFQFALRIIHPRGETVFWGQAWFEENFAAGTLTIFAQDPSLRLQHHYLRLGDDALYNGETGELTADYIGIRTAIDAARNTEDQDTRNDPDIGIAEGETTDINLAVSPIAVERGQEVWDVITLIADHPSGPDFDLHPQQTLPAGTYVAFDCYEHLGTDRAATDPDAPVEGEVVFDYGQGLDNTENIIHRPGRPTTHAHVVDGRLAKASRGNTNGSNETGVFVDWVPVDFMETIADGENLPDIANGRVRVYGRPPKFFEVELRPDSYEGQYLYGHPEFPSNTGQFYIGDTVTVRATRGNRTFATDARIEEVELSVPGARGPAIQIIHCVPTVGDTPVEEEQ